MITFNLQTNNGNYYRGHEPSNHGNCWSSEEHALVLTIEQARAIASAWPGYMKISISVKSEPISEEKFLRELYCIGGGSWHDWPHRHALARMRACCHSSIIDSQNCSCGAKRTSPNEHWYDPGSGKRV